MSNVASVLKDEGDPRDLERHRRRHRPPLCFADASLGKGRLFDKERDAGLPAHEFAPAAAPRQLGSRPTARRGLACFARWGSAIPWDNN